MKKMIVFLVLIALLVAAVPAQAAKETVGERINIYNPEPDGIKFPAEKPFHIMHGWNNWQPSLNQPAEAIGRYKFELWMDGKLLKEDFVDRYALGNPDEWPDDKVDIFIWWVYNFPEGMTGEHTFTGKWYGPCANLYGPESCPNLTKPVLDWSNTVVVTFMP